jgi:hypothetical protein
MKVKIKNLKVKLMLLVCVLFTATFSVYAQAPVYVGPRANIHDDPADGFYVSPDGNDATAVGSIDKPFKSINTALGVAPSGSTIILRSGVYREGTQVRIRKKDITIKSKKGEWATIDLTNDGGEYDSGIYFDPDDKYEVSGCKLQSIEVMGGFYAIELGTRWDWGNPDDRGGVSDIIIEDCKLHDSRNDVIKVKPNCKNITIRYNEIYNSGQQFTESECTPDGRGNAEGIDNVNGDNMVVQNNYIHDICTNGIYAKGGATDALIEDNRIENIKGAGILIGFETNLEYFDTTVNPEYYENIRGVVRNNLIINTVLSGIGFYASKDAQAYNNTLVNVNSHGSYHSAIYFGIATQDGEPYLGSPPNINPNIHHNVVCQPTTFVRPMIEIRYFIDHDIYFLSALDGNPTMNNNCYFIAGKSATFNDRRPGSILENGGLPEWKNHISGDNGSVEIDPLLNANYMTTNPPCEGMGIQHPLIINDPINGINDPTALPETSAYINAGVLYVQSPVAETLQVYSTLGTLLFNFPKPAGEASYLINQPKSTIIIIRGSSGWTKKLMVSD